MVVLDDILAIAKGSEALAKILGDITALYVANKLDRNALDEAARNARNAAAVDAAGDELRRVCATCPNSNHSARLLGDAAAAPAIPAGGESGA